LNNILINFFFIFSIRKPIGEKLNFNVTNVSIYGTEECNINKGIFASDHYGLVSLVEIKLEK
jgi:hypothetical protein